MSDYGYLSCAETAKLVRAALKRAFPTVKFSVRSKTYSGGASIDIDWTDGPTAKAVEAVADQFEGGGFDGMIDMAFSYQHWLMPDGTTVMASSPGTEGSRGSYPRIPETAKPHPDAVRVRFGADYIFEHREISNAAAKIAEAETMIRERCVCEGDRFGNNWIDALARGMVYDVDYLTDDTLENAFRRVVLRETAHAEADQAFVDECLAGDLPKP